MLDRDKKCYQMCGKVVLRQIGDEFLLVPVSGAAAGGRVYPVNESAKEIWLAFQAGNTFGEVVQSLVDMFDVDEAEARADCAVCVELFLSEKLLEERAS